MSGARNLADPDFEPSGEELQALATRAFADVKSRREAALTRMRNEIAAERERILAMLTKQA